MANPEHLEILKQGMEYSMKQIIIILLLLSYATLCHAHNYQTKNNQQNIPDLSGTWELDKSQSKLSKGNPVLKGGTITLTITHNEPQIGIRQKINVDGQEKTKEFLYYTDGRGEVNLANNLYLSFYNGMENTNSNSAPKIESKSRWKGARLITRYAIPVTVPGHTQMSRVDTEEEWVVSPDGKTLIHTSSFIGRGNRGLMIQVEPRKVQRVFNKVS